MESRPLLDSFRKSSTGPVPEFLAGGGEMGERMRQHDWSRSPLGAARDWPQSLRAAVRIMLASRQAVSIWWGTTLINLYNDGCRALVGANHPAALGQGAPVAWREIWDDIGPRVEGAIRGAEPGTQAAVPLLVERHGRVEEAHYTLSFAALPNDDGSMGGVLCTFADVTHSVVWDRQINLLRHVSAHAANASSVDDAAARAVEALVSGASDIPFAAIYFADIARGQATLAASAGIVRGHPALPGILALDADSAWRLHDALAAPRGAFPRVPLAEALFGPLPTGRWSMPPREAVVARLATAPIDGREAVLIAALNPFRMVSDDHRRFIELAAAQVTAAISNVQARREEAVRESDEGSRALVESLPAAVYTTDARGYIDRFNQAAVELWGQRPDANERFSGCSAAFWPDGRPMPLETCPMAQVLLGASVPERSEMILQRPDGSLRHVLAHPRALRDAQGRVTGGVNMLVDITERKAAEAELAFTKDQLALQVETLTRLHQLAMDLGGAPDLPSALQRILETSVETQEADFGLVWLHDPATDRLVVQASHGFDARGRTLFHDIPAGPHGGSAGHAYANARHWVIGDTETDPAFERFRASAREVGFRAVHSTPIVTRSGALLGVISVHYRTPRAPLQREMQAADVCARHAADAIEAYRNGEALRESERIYRAIGESIDYGVWIVDAQGEVKYQSESFLRLVGAPLAEGVMKSWRDVMHPDDLPVVARAWEECMREGRQLDCEYRMKRADGTWQPILGRGVPVRNDRGEIEAWAGINLDIGRLKQVETELRQLDQRKDEFLATLAHELRNPLAPLRNGLEVLRLAGNDAQTLEKARTMMERQLRQMVRLVDDLLDVSRVSRGKIELRREDLELETVLRNALETSQPLMAERRHDVVARIPATPISVHGDLTRLSQVFSNLLNNAAKYTEPGGRIVLEVRPGEEQVEVSVSDTGTGIPQDMLARVFDIFTQVDRSLEKSQGGLGIGLSIAKRLVEMHGGTIEARSDGPARGSEFVVRLPARVGATARPVAESQAAPARVRHRILVADDNADSATTLSLMLEVLGNEVFVAHDGAEALDLARRHRPQAILLDIGMPRMNGYDACARIRQEPWGREPLIVALTGWGQEEDKNRSRDAGFDRHLVKPVEPAMLENLLESLQPPVV